jgi:hypothetical protein
MGQSANKVITKVLNTFATANEHGITKPKVLCGVTVDKVANALVSKLSKVIKTKDITND